MIILAGTVFIAEKKHISKSNISVSLNEIINFAFAEGEQGSSLYDYQLTTKQSEILEINGVLCERTREKVDCIGTGETPCTPSDWSDWSDCI